MYLTVSNEALEAVPNASIPCFSCGAAPRWAGFLTKAVLVLPLALLSCIGTIGTRLFARTRSHWPQALQPFAHSQLFHSSCLLECDSPCHTSLNLSLSPFCQQFFACVIPSAPFSIPFPGGKTLCPWQRILSVSFLPGYKYAPGIDSLIATSFFSCGFHPVLPFPCSFFVSVGEREGFFFL